MKTLLIVVAVLIGGPVLIVLLLHFVGKVRGSLSAAAGLGKRIRGTTDAATRRSLFNELLSMSDQQALSEIAWLGLGDSDKDIRGLASEKLLAAGLDAVVPLIGALDSPGRAMVCYLLGQLGSPVALPSLQQVIARHGEDARVRERAAGAIARIKEIQGA